MQAQGCCVEPHAHTPGSMLAAAERARVAELPPCTFSCMEMPEVRVGTEVPEAQFLYGTSTVYCDAQTTQEGRQ